MGGRLTFVVGRIRPLYEHSLSSEEQRPSFGDLFEPRFHKGGKVKKKGNWPDSDNIDRRLIPKSLHLVGDQGVYLMSGGIPALPGKDGPNAFVYAQECDPDNDPDGWYDSKRAIFGGDDGVERLELEMFKRAMELPDDATFSIKLTRDRIAIELSKDRK